MKLYVLGLVLVATSVFGAEPPYTSGQLRDVFVLKDAELRSAVSEVKQHRGTKRQPTGTVFECYQDGTSGIDLWLSIPTRIYTAPPPSAPSYYRFVYHDGYPVASYRHEAGKTRQSKAYYYDQGMRPVLSVLFDANAKPLHYFLLTYDDTGRIKRVLAFDDELKPWNARCFFYPGEDGVVETRAYNLLRGGGLVTHRVETPEALYAVENGERVKQNSKRRSAFEADFSKFGIRPFYPVLKK